MENRKNRASVIFLSLRGGEGGGVDGECEPDKYGVPQIDDVDQDVLCFFYVTHR